jgi:hypothetical protein
MREAAAVRSDDSTGGERDADVTISIPDDALPSIDHG